MEFKNTSIWDRVTRVVIALVMLALGWHESAGAWAFFLRVFAFYPLITGLAGWCPVYALLHYGSRHRRRSFREDPGS